MGARCELILKRPEGALERYAVPEGGLVIGRGTDCGIVLSDPLVSRRHARIWQEGDMLRVKDLNSRNGIEVNGHKAGEHSLGEGDALTVGASVLRVAKASDSTLGRTVIGAENAAKLQSDLEQAGDGNRIVVLYRAAQLLGTVFEMDRLFREILDLIFEALPVRRGFVLTVEDGSEPAIRATRSRDEDEEQGPPLSHTLIRHVFDTKDAMLTVDAQEDSRFDPSASIVSHHIHAAMCAPLCGRDTLVGAIYVDSGVTSEPFSKGDLEMLTAIARVVGVAVENARLYRDNMAKERLAAVGMATAGLGHCVKNILTGIRGGAEFVNKALETGEIKYLRTGWPILSQAVDRIDLLVNNMLSFSREREPERMVHDLNSLAKDVLALLATRAERNKIVLEHIEEGSGRASVDGQGIYRVILNLVTNAMDACPDGGTVTVTVGNTRDGSVIEVADTGCGIPEDLLPRLSEAFVSTKGSSGTGLGLACSYKIVREHGGRIDVESTLGEGARFRVYLPASPVPGGVTRQLRF